MLGEILNLTQHNATPEQRQAGVLDIGRQEAQRLRFLLTFDSPPIKRGMELRAKQIVLLAQRHEAKTVMIGGAPFFMSILERELMMAGINVVYGFSKRELVSETTENGTVVKRNIFRHLGFVKVEKEY